MANKLKVATTSLAGCFGCHMSFLDIDERILQLAEVAEFDRSPITDIKTCSEDVDIGLIEGGVCNSENVHVLREFRANCKVLIAVGACAVNGGLPAQRRVEQQRTPASFPSPVKRLARAVGLVRRHQHAQNR